MPEPTAVATPNPEQTTTQTQGQQSSTSDTQTATQRTAADPNAGRQTDDRNQGIIRDLQNERRARQDLERRFKELQDTNTARDQRLTQAITGNPAVDAEEQQVREAFARLYPRLARLASELSDDQFEKLVNLADRAEGLEQTTNWQWEKHGKDMIDSVHTAVTDLIGGELSVRQKRTIGRAYADAAGANNPPDRNGQIALTDEQAEFLQRHNSGDRTLVQEFAKQWIDDWFEPARRSVTATEVERTSRRVPRGGDRSVGTTPKKPIDFKDPKAVEDAMVESFRSHGGSFGDK